MANLSLINDLSNVLSYGDHTIKVKAKATGYTASGFSNSVNYHSAPIISRKDGSTLRIMNTRAAATSYEIYKNGTHVKTVPFSGADKDVIDVDITSEFDAGNNNVYVKGVGTGVAANQSPTLAFWKGDNIILGVSGLYQSEPSLTRTDAAATLSWVMSDNKISSDFDDYFPYNQMERVTIDGNVFVKVPAMYWRLGFDSNGYLTDVAVAPAPMEAGSGQIIAHSDEFYYGAYGASYSSGVMKSASGVARQYSQTRAQFRAAAKLNGTGYQLIDLYHTRILELLWLIEFATKNSEAVMWGFTSYNGQCGATDTLDVPSGQLANQGRMRWRYIEDFIGNGYEFFDGIYGLYVTSDPDEYAEANNGTLFSGTNISSGYELAALGYADASNPLLLVPKYAINNSSYNTYFCDQCYVVSGANIVYRGRVSTNASNGLFYWGYYGAANTNYAIGSRLLYKP